MITLTTVTKNGEIHKQEAKPKRFRPIDGWERQKDGSFIRKLDDPRWITMEEMRQKIQKSKEKEKEKRENIKLLPPHPDIGIQTHGDRYIPKHVYCQPKYSRENFLSKLHYMYGSFEGPNVTLHNVRVKEYINCSDIKIDDEYIKIVIDFKKKELYLQKSKYGPIMKVYNLVYE